MRPRSILLFERFYLLAIAISIASAIWSYVHIARLMPMLPPDAPAGVQRMVPLIVAGVSAVSIAIRLLLWYFAARRASNGARWIIVVLFGLALLGLVRSIASFSKVVTAQSMAVAAIVVVLEGACIWLLFRPDASAWFQGEPPAGPGDAFR